MYRQFTNIRFYMVVVADTMIFIVAFVCAYLLRFDFAPGPFYRAQILTLLPFIIPCKLLTFSFFGLFKGMWRYTSMNDLWRLVQASLLFTLLCIGATFYIPSFQGVPRSVFLMDGLLTIIMSGEMRLGIRFYYTPPLGLRKLQFFGFPAPNRSRKKRKSFLILGAGQAGEIMLREIIGNPRLDYHVIGFLDDDRAKWGRTLHGHKVFGGVDSLSKLIKRVNIDEVLIATPSATGPQIRRIVEVCKNCNIRYRTLPEIGAIIDGKVSIKNLRDVKYEDLLRRPPVHLDTMEINRYLQGKRVLVTGAGGSIGSELCRQITNFDPAEIIMVDASEAHLFTIQMQLHHELGFLRYKCILGQVQDQPLMDKVCNVYRPELVFHAAAYKHVPMLENNPWEAIFNNVLGTQVVMDVALKNGVDRFVLVSTDKAVRPINVMGASKRLAEMILQSMNGNGTRFIAVRFGNVIGSSGSVLPLFRCQLEKGGPITVTHPEVTRYFMTIHEAAQLILQAGGLGEGGEIFLLEMGTPVKIAEMAKELIRLSGKEPGEDVEIIFTGLREGEKLFEELITKDEDIIVTKHEKIMVLSSNGHWNGKNNQGEFTQWLNGSLDDLYRIASSHDAQAIKHKLRELLPEYIPQQNVKGVLDSKGHYSAPSVT